MLNTQTSYNCPNIERLIREIEADDDRYDRELRSANRKRIVLPLEIRSMNGKATVKAFSRNLSSAGICLIADRQFQRQTLAKITLFRINRSATALIAESKWCQSFGRDYWISGWQFLQMGNRD